MITDTEPLQSCLRFSLFLLFFFFFDSLLLFAGYCSKLETSQLEQEHRSLCTDEVEKLELSEVEVSDTQRL